LEERVALRESQSKAVIARRPEISEESLALARKKKSIPMKDKPILIVDDEKNIRLTLLRSLEVLGVETDSAEDGKEALEKLKEKEFGLILLDLHMPLIDGVEVLRQVRVSRPDTPIIIITAYGTVKLAAEAKRLGAVDFIKKPFVPEEIRELVTQVIER
jgi:DNA-binding NtrC family response regulator